MKNLVILHPHLLYPSGASKYMLEVADRLSKRGICITVVLTKYDRNLVKPYNNLRFVEIGNHHTGELIFWLTFPIFFLKLKKTLDRIEDKLLFPQIFPPVWWAALYKFISPKTKAVWMCHEPSAFIHSPLVIRSLRQPGRTLVFFLNPFLKLLDKIFVKKIDYIIANSVYGQELIKEIYGRRADIYAYPSVDTQKYRPIGKKEKYIFTVSRLDKQKNIDVLIKAYSLLPKKITEIYKLIIGGSGKEENNLKKLAKGLGIKDRVEFLGPVEERALPSYYAKAEITIFLGENEPFGMVPVESMSCGTPVIALKNGGVTESVIEDKTGILLDKKDENKLANGIEKLITDKLLLKKMSINARKHVLKNFSWDKTADKIYHFISTI